MRFLQVLTGSQDKEKQKERYRRKSYRAKLSNRARTTIPAIIRIHRTLITKEMIFTLLRLSLFHTQITDRNSPARTETIWKPVNTVRTPSDRVILKFSIVFYLISFLPNCVTARANTRPNANIAQGRNGNNENAVLADSSVKS